MTTGGNVDEIFGIVLLTIGVIFGSLLVLARLGGANMPVTSVAIAAALIVTGWRLKKYSGVLGQRKQFSAPIADANAETVSPTTELPLAATQQALIVRTLKHTRRVMAMILLSGMLFFLLLGAGMDLLVPSPKVKILPYLAVVSVVWGLIFGGLLIFGERPTIRDLRGSTYLRTTGPVRLVPVFGGFLLTMADRSFLVSGRQLTSALRKVTWATVDYSRRSHIVFEVRDRSGQSLYRRPGYELES